MRPFSWGVYLCAHAAFAAVHFPTTRKLPRLASFAVLTVALLYTWSSHLFSPGEDYVLGSSNGILLATAFNIVFLAREFPDGVRRAKDNDAPSKFTIFGKLEWMLDISSNLRRVGFSTPTQRYSYTPSPSTRRKFVLSRVVLALTYLSVFQLCIQWRAGNPSFDPSVHPSSRDGSYIRQKPFLLRTIDVISWAIMTASEMVFLQSVAGALSVASGALAPEAWPNLFGSPLQAYTVKRFWSRTWHQTLRYTLGSYGRFVAYDCLNLRPGTSFSAYTQLVIAFFVSALIHIGGDYSVHRSYAIGGPTLRFFLLQPVAILCEETARHIMRPQKHHARIWKAVGYIWVLLWFTWSAPPYLDSISIAGGHIRTKVIAFKMLEFLKFK